MDGLEKLHIFTTRTFKYFIFTTKTFKFGKNK